MSEPNFMQRAWMDADKPVFWSLIGLMLLIIMLWRTIIIYPLKILVVFFHEISHGLVALFTGGAIKQIQLVAMEGGLCVTSGGNLFLVMSAGYLGSMLWGGIILLLASRKTGHKGITLSLGVLLALITLLWVRPPVSFGFIFAVLTSAALIFAGIRFRPLVNAYILKVIGLTSMLYAPLDIISDVLQRPGMKSDAWMLAQLTHIPTVIWGLVWTALAILGAAYFLLAAAKKRPVMPADFFDD